MSHMHPYCATKTQLETLIPSKGPDKKPGAAGEQKVYEFFRDHMPADWHVFYNDSLDLEGIDEHQLDFVVVVPGLGVANIDAKGRWYYLEDGTIYLRKEEGCPGVPVDIYGKASGAAKSFDKYVRKKISNGESWGAYSHLILFALSPIVAPDTARDAAFSLLGADEAPGDVARDLEICIRKRLNYPRENARFSQYMRRLIEHLARNDHPAQINQDFVEWDKISEQMLTGPQQQVVNRLRTNDHCHVKGAAGTGKTIIALALAKWYAQQGKDVLYVCFNNALAAKLRRKVGNFDGHKHVSITNFDQIESVFGRTPCYGRYDNNRRAWDDYLLNALPNLASREGRFDVLLVDEAQDLSHAELMILLSCLQKERKVVLFSDAEQTIFAWNETGAWDYDEEKLFQGQPVAELRLDTNYRNTSEIHAEMKEYEDKDSPTWPYWTEAMLHAKPVQVRRIPSGQVRKTLSEVLNHAGMNQIAFLTSRKELLAMYQPRGWQDEVGHQIRFVEGMDKDKAKAFQAWERGEGVLKATIQGFKGLESGIVFLFGLDQAGEELTYVGESRAKWELYIVE